MWIRKFGLALTKRGKNEVAWIGIGLMFVRFQALDSPGQPLRGLRPGSAARLTASM